MEAPTRPEPATLQAAQAAARALLGPDGGLDAALLLAHVIGKSPTYLHTWPERVITPEEWERFSDLVARRARGEPVAYLTGHREFWSLDLRVTPATLIPRPDTETLVAEALARIPAEAAWPVADLGTGSGAVALAIARERPASRVVATDASAEALAVAAENARRLAIDNVAFAQGHWFESVPGRRFRMVLSNPPYIPEGDRHLAEGDLPFEPRSALVAGEDGLADLRLIIAGAPAHLEPGGWLLLEHGWDQGEAVRRLLTAAGFLQVESHADLGGRERVSLGRLPGAAD